MELLAPTVDFALPVELEAIAPPGARARRPASGRLMASSRPSGRIEHRRFAELPEVLRAGDLLVVNRSATWNAALDVKVDAEPAVLHLSRRLADRQWIVELRHLAADGRKTEPWLDSCSGTEIQLP